MYSPSDSRIDMNNLDPMIEFSKPPVKPSPKSAE